jgi:transcriptional regulator with XRE-family HTH domain
MADNQAFYATVGRRIRKAREEKGLTQEALASLVHLTRTSITNIERGRQKLLLHTFVEMANALRVPPAALLSDTEAAMTEDVFDSHNALKDLPSDEREWIESALGVMRER